MAHNNLTGLNVVGHPTLHNTFDAVNQNNTAFNLLSMDISIWQNMYDSCFFNTLFLIK